MGVKRYKLRNSFRFLFASLRRTREVASAVSKESEILSEKLEGFECGALADSPKARRIALVVEYLYAHESSVDYGFDATKPPVFRDSFVLEEFIHQLSNSLRKVSIGKQTRCVRFSYVIVLDSENLDICFRCIEAMFDVRFAE